MSCKVKYNTIESTYEVYAPNNEKSLLYESILKLSNNQEDALKLWATVYSTSFKNWFGDWEKFSDLEKEKYIKAGILDANGEPKLLYRADSSDEFTPSDRLNDKFGKGIYIAENIMQSQMFALDKKLNVYPVFIKPSDFVDISGKNSKTKFLKEVAKYLGIKTVPTAEQVDLYVSDLHLSGKIIIGEGTFGKEYNIANNDQVRTIFKSKLEVNKDKDIVKEISSAVVEKRKTDTLLNNIIDKLKTNLNLPEESIQYIDEESAKQITKDSKNPYNGQKGFYYKGTVYLVKGKFNASTQIHEISHIFIRAIRYENPTLFNKLFEDLSKTEEGKQYINEARLEYQDEDSEIVKEEALVKALTKGLIEHGINGSNISTTKGFSGVIKRILMFFKNLINKISKKKISSLNSNTTLKELTDQILDNTWDIESLDTLSDDDIVAYISEVNELSNGIMNILDKTETKTAISKLVLDNLHIIQSQLKSLNDFESKEELEYALKNSKGLFIYNELLTNLKGFSKKEEIQRLINDKIDDIEYLKKKVIALTSNVLVLDNLTNKLSDHIELLKNHPDERDALTQVNMINNFTAQWLAYINNALGLFNQAGLNTDDKIISELLNIKYKLESLSDKSLSIYEKAVSNALYDSVWKPYIDSVKKEKLKEIEKLKKSNPKLYEKKKESLDKELERLAESKEEFNKYLKGKYGDLGTIHAYFENYLSSQDPTISSFTMYLKKHLSKANTSAQNSYYDFMNEIKDDLEELGIDPSKIDKFADQFIFEDESYEWKDGKLEKKKVYTFLNEFKDYRYDLRKLDYDIEQARINWEEEPSEENKIKYVNAILKKENHLKLYFNRPYIKEVYDIEELLTKDEIGRKAKEKIDSILTELSYYQNNHADSADFINNYQKVEQLLKEYNSLFSLYDDYGNLKKGEELELTKRLQKYRELKSKYYEFEEIPGAFETAIEVIKEKIHTELLYENYKEGTEEYEKEFNKRYNIWYEHNTTLGVSEEHLIIKRRLTDKIAELIEENNEILNEYGKKGVLDTSALYKDIFELKKPYYINGEFKPELVPEDIKSKILDIEKQIQKLKNEYFENTTAKFSKNVPSDIKNKYYSNAELIKTLFKELNEIEVKVINDEMLDIMNNFYSRAGLEFKEEMKYYDYFIESIISNLNQLNEIEEFREFFKKNFVDTSIVLKYTGEIKENYKPISIWYKSIPKDEKHIERKPSLKYFRRKVKDQYKTGYNPETGKVELKLGKHIDAKGNFLPLSYEELKKRVAKYPDEYKQSDIPFDKYINHEYLELKNKNDVRFRLLEKIKNYHIETQEKNNLTNLARLGYDLPRYRKKTDEYALEFADKQPVFSKLKAYYNETKQNFLETKDDYQEDFGLNFEIDDTDKGLESYYVSRDKIPITGIFNIDLKNTSKDIFNSIFTYRLSAEQNAQLREAQPIAIAMKTLVDKFNPLDIKKMKKMSLETRLTAPVYSKTNNRKKVVEGIVETIMEGKVLYDNNNLAKTAKIINASLKMASFSYFAFDITSALKNSIGMQLQVGLEGVGKKYMSYKDFMKGKPWAIKAAYKWSVERFSATNRSLETQMIELFDPIQDLAQQSFGRAASRSMKRDALSFTWPTAFRKNLEMEATLELFAGLMYKEKVPMQTKDGIKYIPYIEAWELKDGRIKLKDGVDERYDVDGEEFERIKFKVHELSNLLQGAYAKIDQPLVSRYILFRLVGALRKYFTKMFIDRYAFRGSIWNPQERYNLALGSMHMGFYIRTFKILKDTLKYGGSNLLHLTEDEARALRKSIIEIAKVISFQFMYMLLWGFDDDDPDKWKKRKGEIDTGALFPGSGALSWMGLTDEEATKNFNAFGWMGNQLLLLAMNVESEAGAFVPLPTPNRGLQQMANTFAETSIAAQPSLFTTIKLLTQLTKTITFDDTVYYKKDVGALKWQRKESNKIWNTLAKAFGIKGKWEDPYTHIKNYRGFTNK